MMGEWLVLILHMVALIDVGSLNQAKSQLTVDKMNKSSLAIRERCVCPGHTLILECIVVAPQGGSTVWSGTAFDCPNKNNEIVLLHTRFSDSELNGAFESCNNGSIVARSFRTNHDEEPDTYTSQLNVTINSNILGQTITCHFDNGTHNTTLSTVVTAQFNLSEIKYSVSTTGNGRTISFTWHPFNISTCPAIPYILASNCGSCPTTTNHTAITCTDVPTDATYCTFALIPTLCSSVSPNLSVLLDVKLKDSNEGQSGFIAACILLTLIIVALLILIGIALLFRFRGCIKRMFQFQCDNISIGTRLCSNQTREFEPQLQCHYTSQLDENGIYSCVDKNSETNGSVLKIFDNESEEKGIYGIDEDNDQHKPQYYNTGCQAQANSQTMNPLSKLSGLDDVPPVNLENLLIKFGDKVKSQWYKFGEAIGVPRDYLDTLSGGNDELQCLRNVMDHWLKHHQCQPMWEEVFEAQRKVKPLNGRELKDKEADCDVDVPPPKPPRRRSSVNRSISLIINSSH